MKSLSILILLLGFNTYAATVDYQLNGITQIVKQDTVTPANSKPLPMQYLNLLGVRTDLATEATMQSVNTNVLAVGTAVSAINTKTPALGQAASAASVPVVIASNQTTLPVSQVAATGSPAQITNLVATAQTIVAPANAIGFKIQAPSTNTENIAFSIGSTATITAGILMEPGRSEDFDVGQHISVIATSATAQKVTVMWRIKP